MIVADLIMSRGRHESKVRDRCNPLTHSAATPNPTTPYPVMYPVFLSYFYHNSVRVIAHGDSVEAGGCYGKYPALSLLHPLAVSKAILRRLRSRWGGRTANGRTPSEIFLIAYRARAEE